MTNSTNSNSYTYARLANNNDEDDSLPLAPMVPDPYESGLIAATPTVCNPPTASALSAAAPVAEASTAVVHFNGTTAIIPSNNGTAVVARPVSDVYYRESDAAVATAQIVELMNEKNYRSITGNDLIKLLEKDRNRATFDAGFLGGVVGLIFLGPIGALVCGGSYALFTKQDLHRREDVVRWQLSGRLHEPLSQSMNNNIVSINNDNGLPVLSSEIVQSSATSSITGNVLLRRLEKKRKNATWTMGVVGGAIGMLFLGPVGALILGTGNALITKFSLKRREEITRYQLGGRLDEPLPVRHSIGYY